MNVFELQAGLLALGFNTGKVDGVPGEKTRGAAIAALKKLAPGNRVGLRNPAQVLVGAEQLIMKIVGGLAVGPIDGIVGPVTRKARLHWLRGPWRNQLMKALPGDERFPRAVRTVWPKQSDMAAYFGAPGTNQTLLYTPYPLRLYTPAGEQIHRFSCNTRVKDSLGRVLKTVLAQYGYERIKELRLDVFSGCLNVRAMRGGTNLSTHAYGAAVDWDAQRNSLRSNRHSAAMARPEYDAWWKAWTDEGWLSLGKARDFDWMHVQAARLG